MYGYFREKFHVNHLELGVKGLSVVQQTPVNGAKFSTKSGVI